MVMGISSRTDTEISFSINDSKETADLEVTVTATDNQGSKVGEDQTLRATNWFANEGGFTVIVGPFQLPPPNSACVAFAFHNNPNHRLAQFSFNT